MKILVVSDTHGITSQLEEILARHADEVKMVCHIGNAPGDLTKFQPKFPNLQMVAIRGNGDHDFGAQSEVILQFLPCLDSGKEIITKILLVHGHNHGVYSSKTRLVYYAEQKGVNAVLFGHTHVPYIDERAGIFIMNPGSPSCPRDGSKASYGIIEISPTGEITGEVFDA